MMVAIDHQPFRVGIDRQGIEHHLPDTRVRPPSEPLVDTRPQSVHARHRAPVRPIHITASIQAPRIARAANITGLAGSDSLIRSH
jgi:hypothetical protein